MTHTSEHKKEILNNIYAIWSQTQHLRLGQLLTVACKEVDLFYVEDAQLIRFLEDFNQK